MKHKVSRDALRSIVQRNLYARCCNYELENEELCRMAQDKYGYRTGVWVTENQIINATGKYLWHGLKVLNGEKPHIIITKRDNSGVGNVRTPVYNIDQTNFAIVAPGAYDLMLQGKSFNEVCNTLMHQPLAKVQEASIVKTKPSFMKRIASVF